jgi:hypothetical protein
MFFSLTRKRGRESPAPHCPRSARFWRIFAPPGAMGAKLFFNAPGRAMLRRSYMLGNCPGSARQNHPAAAYVAPGSAPIGSARIMRARSVSAPRSAPICSGCFPAPRPARFSPGPGPTISPAGPARPFSADPLEKTPCHPCPVPFHGTQPAASGRQSVYQPAASYLAANGRQRASTQPAAKSIMLQYSPVLIMFLQTIESHK